ncbi:OsmC family protein [Sandarakinorhabdus sp.]|uniref:OsmC family protein n=1 Tax=Sandarakinorhabdus sp. TaxID=1916663 RepID=UPI00286DE016|nr:OsmC family protein [Sandarakinorhabdus sp.]
MITIRRDDPAATRHIITIGAHQLVADMSVASGGADAGPDPHDLYDAALGACKALTMVWYANRKGLPLGDVGVAVTRDNTEERAGVYRLTATITLGGDLTDAQRAELLAVAGKCPVHKLMTAVETRIETRLA